MTQREQLGISRAQLAQQWRIHADELEEQKETVAHEKYLAVEHLKAQGVPETQALQQVEAIGVGQPGSTPYITMQVYQQIKAQHPEVSDGDAWTQAVQRVKDASSSTSAAAGKEKDAHTLAAEQFKKLHGRDPGPDDEPEMAKLRQASRASEAPPTIDAETGRLAAEALIKGDKSVLMNFGRGAQGAANIAFIRNIWSQLAKERRLTGADIAAADVAFAGAVAGMRTASTAGARIDIGANELQVALPQALALSQQVWRSDFKPLASLQQAARGYSSDPDLLEFAQQNQAVINAYAATMSRGGASTVAAGERAAHILSIATGQEGYARQLDRLNKEVQQMEYGTDEAKQQILNTISGRDTEVQQPTLTGVPVPAAGADQPPVPNARKAPDGKWYVPDPNRAGKYLQVQ
jgi:hypothetical protein